MKPLIDRVRINQSDFTTHCLINVDVLFPFSKPCLALKWPLELNMVVGI